MPKCPSLKKILVIGSGPIIIGQGCEFDYSGAQACKALREEGCTIVLFNSNPATIMTDQTMADATYIAPMNLATCIKILEKERPNALLPTLGGQTALNLSLKLAEQGVLENLNIRLIGASVAAIQKAENRKLFREAMSRIGLETPHAYTVNNLTEIQSMEKILSFPLIVRSSFTLGGLGSGIAHHFIELLQICEPLFTTNPRQTLELEESLLGWKEFEMEAIRDNADNCIIVCSLENVDAMGVHTGDSITVAPALTLCNKEYQRMRQATFAILREIGVNTGGANVQFAVHPETGRMLVIEMNPRVSRSSALASKATGYPIAKVATKLALGYTLDELDNTLTSEKIPASFEPTIDYVVTKIPRFNFEKFPHCKGILTTKMQSTGEVIGIGRNFQESLHKALCSLEKNVFGLMFPALNQDLLLEKLTKPYYDRLFYIAEAFRQNMSLTEIYAKTHIDQWFLAQIQELIHLEQFIHKDLSREDFFLLKRKGFSDQLIADFCGEEEAVIRRKRQSLSVFPTYKQVDSCAAEFNARTVCLYSTYEEECEAQVTNHKKLIIIGSGPNRIGQGLEFDYGSVHAALASKRAGYETIMINSNPETVSTDYDIVDRLYLEPLTPEHILNIMELEKPLGVVTQFGGQTALNLLPTLLAANISVLGTSASAVDTCENRDLFQKLVAELGFQQPDNFCVHSLDEWIQCEDRISYPIIVRPSYLLSGSAMKIIRTREEFLSYEKLLGHNKQFFPILIEKYLENAIEVEVDGVCDGSHVFIPGVMEQVEPAGIHSGDSICFFPAHTLSQTLQLKIMEQARHLALAVNIIGLFNIQFAIQGNKIFIIEMNPRSSRTVPFLSKALGISLPQIAMRCMLGISLVEQDCTIARNLSYFAIKTPVFPFERLGHTALGPEMLATGESMLFSKRTPEKRISFPNFEICSLQELVT